MADEKTITVTLESGTQAPNPVTTQPSLGHGPFPSSYQPVITSPQQGGYGIQPAVYGPTPGVPTGPQGGFGIPPSTGFPSQVGYGIPQGPGSPQQGGFANVSPQPGYGIQPPPGHYGQPGQNQPPEGNYNTNGSHITVPPTNNWMTRPQNIPNCPPGLEYLTTIDTLIVNQIFNIGQALSEREPENEFMVTNSIGQKLYYAKEESDDCSRRLCGSKRAFRLKVFDNFGNQVMNLSRPIACQACCFPCCLQKMEVSAPPSTVVGVIDQEWAFIHPTFAIKGPTGDVILRIQGPWCTMNCYADVEFKVLTSDGANEVGKISKRWSGYSNDNSAKMDVFGISFPMDLDVRMKAVMLGACFLIDMMYFEQSVSNPNKVNTRTNQTQQQELKPI